MHYVAHGAKPPPSTGRHSPVAAGIAAIRCNREFKGWVNSHIADFIAVRGDVVRIRTLTANSHTLEAVDLGSILETTGSSAVTVTIPDEVTVPFEIGALINVTQVGAGIATVAATPGVSLNGVTGGSVALDGQWSGAALVKRGADAWVIQGALAGAVT